MGFTMKLAAVAGGVLFAAGLHAQMTGSPGASNPSGAEATTSSGQTTGRSATPGPDTSRSAADNPANMPMLKSFAMKAADGGMAEVELGRLAAQKGSNDRVKQFGQKMVDDHTRANNELKQAAGQSGIELPSDTSAKHKQLVQKLSGLSGAAFDRAYMDAMVKDHVEDVAEFEKASKAPGNSPIRTFAASTLPTLKEHLQMARDIDSEVKGTAAKSGPGTAKPASPGGAQSY